MKYNFNVFLFVLLLIYTIISPTNSLAVCDLATLKMELLQDIEDNGMLDCKKQIPEQRDENESEAEKIKRIAAQWDSSCSFESSQNWEKELKDYYGIDHLVNSIGEPYVFNPKVEADMCVIVRTILHKKIQNLPMYKIPKSVINGISCPGSPHAVGNINDIDRKKICAATGGSFFDTKGWSIFLQPSAIIIGDTLHDKPVKPKFNLATSGNMARAKSN